MTADMIFSQGVPFAVLAAIGIFIWRELWPYIRLRDVQERDRRDLAARGRAAADVVELDRRHELELRQVEASGLLAGALGVLADAVRGCPVNASIDDSQVLQDRLHNVG